MHYKNLTLAEIDLKNLAPLALKVDWTRGSRGKQIRKVIAAKKLHRNFIGIEISPEYFKVAENRLKQEVLAL